MGKNYPLFAPTQLETNEEIKNEISLFLDKLMPAEGLASLEA